MPRRTVTSVALALLVLAAGCAGAGGAGAATPAGDGATDSSGRQIAVAATGSAADSADQAVVRLGVRATDENAVAARRALAENVSRMREALMAAGVDEDAITTTRYDIDRDLERPRQEGGEPRVRYRATHSFRVTVEDTDRVGTVIDTAVRNGATSIDGVEFTLSAERRERLGETARQRAMASARRKASQLAATENLTITGVRTIRTVSEDGPRPAVEAAAATPTATPSAPTDLDAAPVSVTVRVEVVYEAEASESSA
ncbi:MAG: SIMPL domain-containing protein [Haloferacaceae archaeon]